jgi:hypothetical protein
MATNDVDLFLTAHRQMDAGVDREEREADHPSDHSPVWAEIAPARRGARWRPRDRE